MKREKKTNVFSGISGMVFKPLLIMLIVVIGLSINTLMTLNKTASQIQTVVNQYFYTEMLVKDFQLHIEEIRQYLTDVCATRGKNGLDDGYDEAKTAYYTLRKGQKQEMSIWRLLTNPHWSLIAAWT